MSGVGLTGKIEQLGSGVFKLVDAYNVKYTFGIEVDTIDGVKSSVGEGALQIPEEFRSAPLSIIYNKHAYRYLASDTTDGAWGNDNNWDRLASASTTELQGKAQGTANSTTDPNITIPDVTKDGYWWLCSEDYNVVGDYSNFTLASGQNYEDIKTNSWLWYNNSLQGFVIMQYKVDENVLIPLIGDLQFDLDILEDRENPLDSDDYGNTGVTKAIQSIQSWGKGQSQYTVNLRGQDPISYPSGNPSTDYGVNIGDILSSKIAVKKPNFNINADNQYYVSLDQFLDRITNNFEYNTGYGYIDDNKLGPVLALDYLGKRLHEWEYGYSFAGQDFSARLLPKFPTNNSGDYLGYYPILSPTNQLLLARLNRTLVSKKVYDSTLVSDHTGKQNAVVTTNSNGLIPIEVIPAIPSNGSTVYYSDKETLSEFVSNINVLSPSFKSGDLVLIDELITGDSDEDYNKTRVLYACNGDINNLSSYYKVIEAPSWGDIQGTSPFIESTYSVDIAANQTGIVLDCQGKNESAFELYDDGSISPDMTISWTNPSADIYLSNIPTNGLVSIRVAPSNSSAYKITPIDSFHCKDYEEFDDITNEFYLDGVSEFKSFYLILRFYNTSKSGDFGVDITLDSGLKKRTAI